MADGGIQMSEAFSHFLFVLSLSERVHEGPSAPICGTQTLEHSNKKRKSIKQAQKNSTLYCRLLKVQITCVAF